MTAIGHKSERERSGTQEEVAAQQKRFKPTMKKPTNKQKKLGYIISVFGGIAWLTQDGFVTTEKDKRGFWDTRTAAARAMRLSAGI